jgi:hypothetical protein
MKRFLEIGFILLLIAVVGCLVIGPMVYRTDRDYPIKKVELEMSELVFGMEGHHHEFGSYPSGMPAEILAVLFGNNPQKLVFLSVGKANTNSTGEFIDPWRTPYQIIFDSSNHFTIWSAGKNKRFGDGDDFRKSNWKTDNESDHRQWP